MLNFEAFAFVILAVCAATIPSAHATDPSFTKIRPGSKDRSATHGMLILGGRQGSEPTRTVLISHLPMGMAPHDRQAIFEGELDAKGTAAYTDIGGNPRKVFYTVDPGQFVLPTFLTSLPARRTAELFTGIFDSTSGPLKGEPIQTGIGLQFKRLLYGDLIPSAAGAGTGAPYALIALGAEKFLVHRVTRAGSEFDQFVAVTALDAGGILGAKLQRQTSVLLKAKGLGTDAASAHKVAQKAALPITLDDDGTALTIATGAEEYFFADDLQ